MSTLISERYIPRDYVPFTQDAELGIEIFWGEFNNRVYMIGYKGRAIKSAFHLYFGNKNRAIEYASSFIDGIKKSALAKKQRREERKNKPMGFVVGDVLVSSWGYEQTNVDYFQVISLIGKSSVEIRSIAQHVEHEGQDYGRCTPALNTFIGESFVKRVIDNRVKLSSFQSAWKKDYQVVGGMKIFSPDYWSSYA